LNDFGYNEIFSGKSNNNINTNFIDLDLNYRYNLKDLFISEDFRLDKGFYSNGLDIKCPFLDKYLIEFYLSIPVKYKWNLNYENFCLQNIFLDEILQNSFLPNEIFLNKNEVKHYKIDPNIINIIQNFTKKFYNSDNDLDSEQKYYKYIYDLNFLQNNS